MKHSIRESVGSGDEKSARVDPQMVRPSEVPEYLRDSEFYKSLNLEDDEEFFVPVNFMKADMNVASVEGAISLLHTIRFWGIVNTVPISFVLFAASQHFEKIAPVLRSFAEDLPFAEKLVCILDSDVLLVKRMEMAMEFGVVPLVEALEKLRAPFTQRSVALAAAHGHLDCLRVAAQKPIQWKEKREGVYEEAVANGQLACVQLIDETILPLDTFDPVTKKPRGEFFRSRDGAKMVLTQVAVEHGQHECLKYLHERGCPLNKCDTFAASGGSLPCLKYVVEHCPSLSKSADLCVVAAQHGHHHCLAYLLEQQYPLSEQVCEAAATAGSLACLSLAHKRGCAMSQEVCIQASLGGSVPCLQYFHANGGEWHYLACHAAALHDRLSCLQYLCDHGCPLVAPGGTDTKQKYPPLWGVAQGPAHLVKTVAARKHWGCVTYLILQGCPLTRELTEVLAAHHKDSLMQRAVERGCPVATAVAVRYATAGDLQGLKYAMEHGCDPSVKILLAAARNGHLPCLTYAHQRHCPWAAEVCVAAARNGHLQCLRYAREQGCPWNSMVLWVAEQGEHEEVVRYARENGCPEEEV